MAGLALGNCLDRRLATYRMLTGHDAANAVVAQDRDFDAHVFASLLAVAAAEQGALSARLGLGCDDLAALVARWFPHARALSVSSAAGAEQQDDEVAMVRDLLLAHRSTPGEDGRALAAIIARRAMEPNHLWEDLGLRCRSELSRLLARHFAPLAARNTKNMRWKRFFYRTLCESDGLVMCTTPVCTACCDFNLCFGDESGESQVANRRRNFALQVAA